MSRAGFLAGLLLVALGCNDRSSQEQWRELVRFGIAYHEHFFVKKVGPGSLDELTNFSSDSPWLPNHVFSSGFPKLAKQIREGDLIVVWKADLYNDGNESDKYVLGHYKNAAETGGWVLFGGGTVKKMKAEDFKKLSNIRTRNE